MIGSLSGGEPAAPPSDPLPAVTEHPAATSTESRQIYDPGAGGLTAAALFWRADLSPGTHLTGPAVIAEDETSTVVPQGFTARIDAGGAIVLTLSQETAP